MINCVSKKNVIGDYCIISAVFIQPLLILLQQILIYAFYMPQEQTTTYRVLLTGIPMSIAILLSASRKPFMFISAYCIAIFLLLLTIVLFPGNEEYVKSESLRFFLPVVLPSALCLMTIKDYDKIKKIFYIVSVVASFEVLFFVYCYFQGRIFVYEYNMSFSYACLPPMIFLYSEKKLFSQSLSLFLFFVILAIGSRGAAIIFVSYVIIEFFQKKKNRSFLTLCVGIVIAISLSAIGTYFSSISIRSRTLNMVDEGNIGSYSGRDVIWSHFINDLINNPMGIGLYGDRIFTQGVYCHNLFLEICLNFGLIIGGAIIVYFVHQTVKIYKKSNETMRGDIRLYIMAFVAPFLFSDSYLRTNGFFLAVGVLMLIKKRNRNKIA